MQNSQSGATLFEVLGYISLLGAIGVGITSAASTVIKETRYKREIAEIRAAEKEIRILGLTLNNYIPPSTYSNLTSYFCDYERAGAGSDVLSICRAGSKTVLETSYGRAISLGLPGDFSGDNTYLSLLADKNLSRPFFTIRFNITNEAECLNFAEATWGPSVHACVVSSSTFSCSNYRTACTNSPTAIALFFK
ncbi:MAG: hypothetical protein IKD08_05825 [Alphaproteobacteria bacterium]|nr:hypothetical protein [Alphaproteobacteria bacterium]